MQRPPFLPMRLIALFAFGVATCFVSPPASSDEPPLVINVILPLTGAAAFVGGDEKVAIQIYEGLVNKSGGVRGRMVHFQILDDESSPQVDLQLVNTIAEQHAPVFIGPAVNASCAAVEPVVRNTGPVEYCLSPALTPQKGSYVFAGARSLDATDAPVARFVNEKKYNRIALLSSTDGSGQAGSRAFTNAVASYPSVQIVDEEKFAPAAITVAAEVAKIKALNPQAIFIHASGPAFGTVLRGLKDTGIVDIPVFTSSANLSKQQLAQYAAFLPRDLYFDGFPWQGGPPRNAAMRSAYNTFATAYKNAGITPTSISGYAWDPTVIVVSAFNRLGPNATAQQIRDYIATLHDFAGIDGTYDFQHGSDQHGLGSDSTILVKWSQASGDVVAASRPGGIPL